jgi:hypothetical protein
MKNARQYDYLYFMLIALFKNADFFQQCGILSCTYSKLTIRILESFSADPTHLKCNNQLGFNHLGFLP